MSPLDVIKDWTNCSDVDIFMEHVLLASDKLSTNRPDDRKLQQVAKASFNNRVCHTYKVIAQYLNEHFVDLEQSPDLYPQTHKSLQILSERLEMLSLYAGPETPSIQKARVKAEKIIIFLGEKIIDSLQEQMALTSKDSEQLVLGLETLGVPQAEIKLITFQYQRIPFIQSAVKEIISLYSSNLNNASSKIDQKLHILLQNLLQYTHSLDGLTKIVDSQGSKLISQATLGQFTMDNVKALPKIQPYLLGERLLRGKGLIKVQNKMLTMAKNIEASLRLSSSELKQKRADSPLSPIALIKQAKMQESLRQATIWTAEQDQLIALGKSQNRVFKIQNANNTETVAYYKESPNKGPNAEIMEQLMWDSAVIMGFENQFVATTRINLRTKEHFKNKGESVKTWNAKGGLINKEVKGSRQGGFQPIQVGVSLYDYINDPKVSIPRSQLVKGILASSIFGLFDAHRKNIIIDNDGNIKFFDNASSMPHSNSCILWGGTILRSSFRCCLLNLPQTQVPLTPEDRQIITDEIDKCRANYQQLLKFYENPITIRSKISKLPKDWFHTKQVLEAMQERIQRLEAAALHPKITTLCDLALASQPNLRFLQAMNYIFYYADCFPCPHNQDYLGVMDMIGQNTIEECISKCCKKGIDPKVVKQWCDDPNLSFDRVIKNISTNTQRIDSSEAKKNGDEIMRQLKSTAKPDFKDITIS